MIEYLVNHLMLPILEFFHGLTGSYGWAIVFLTLVIKAALMPLTVSQFRSMLAMQKLQPRLKELQERYKGRPEELNKRLMELYKEHKVNPLGGCLPLLIQLPFLFALYSALIGERFTTALAASGKPGWYFIQDLARTGAWAEGAVHWDILVLILLFGITTFMSQKMMMTGNDPMQRQMLYTMPIFITATFIFFPIPAGVLLYIVISNVVTVIQNLWMKRTYGSNAPAQQPSGKLDKKK